jgi:hypothetical protein
MNETHLSGTARPARAIKTGRAYSVRSRQAGGRARISAAAPRLRRRAGRTVEARTAWHGAGARARGRGVARARCDHAGRACVARAGAHILSGGACAGGNAPIDCANTKRQAVRPLECNLTRQTMSKSKTDGCWPLRLAHRNGG